MHMFRAQMSVYNMKTNQEHQQFKNKFNYAGLILPTLLVSAYLYGKQDETPAMAAEPDKKNDDRGKKENKVRFFGAPKEIYNYFATNKEDDGSMSMSYQDFFRCLTPYQYRKSRSKRLIDQFFDKNHDSINEVMKVADVDLDGSISFIEFFVFIVVL